MPVLEPVIAPLEHEWGDDPGFGRRCRGQGLPIVRLLTPHCLHSDPWQRCYLAVHAECGASYRRRGANSGVYGRLWRRSFTAAFVLRSPSAPCSPIPTIQMILSPSNARPLVVCGAVLVALFALLLATQFFAARNVHEQRRTLYRKSGSFSWVVPLPNVPQDVRALAPGTCMSRAIGANCDHVVHISSLCVHTVTVRRQGWRGVTTHAL
jgi:hypothetical protein